MKSILRRTSHIYWYMCSGDDYQRIAQIKELAEENNLKAPKLFVLTDNSYVISNDGRVRVHVNVYNRPERQYYFENNFHIVETYDSLFNFNYSQADECKLVYFEEYWRTVNGEYELCDFFNVRTFAEVRNKHDFFDIGITEEDFANLTRDQLHLLYVQRVISKRKIAALYKHNEQNLFVLLLATDNMDFIQSQLGEKIYAIIGTQNAGHNATEEVNSCPNYRVLFKLSAGGQIDVNRDDVLIVDTPYEIQ